MAKHHGHFRKRLSFLACIVLVAQILSYKLVPAEAYTFIGPCGLLGRNPSWSSSEPYFEQCNSSNGFPAFNLNGDLSTNSLTRADARRVFVDGFAAWRKDDAIQNVGVVSSSCESGAEDGAWFRNGGRTSGNLDSRFWYENRAVTTSTCGASAWGCTGPRYHCGVQLEMRSADILINHELQWPVALIDDVQECVDVTDRAFPTTVLHEIGHGFMLDHPAYPMSLMYTEGRRVLPCKYGARITSFPTPDDMNGALSTNGTNPSRPNFSGTAQYIGNSGNVEVDMLYAPEYLSTTIDSTEVTYTLFNYFRGGHVVEVAGYLIPTTTRPMGGATGMSIPSTAVFAGEDTILGSSNDGSWDMKVSTLFFWGSDNLQNQVEYRLWIILDPNNLITETDEGDNAIATNVLVSRSYTNTGGGC